LVKLPVPAASDQIDEDESSPNYTSLHETPARSGEDRRLVGQAAAG
jgi:hypothetical protein